MIKLILSKIYGFFVKLNNRRFVKSYKSDLPVISVGGIEMGGSGKTPLTIYICSLLNENGFAPVVLSRGYKRLDKDRVVLFSPDDFDYKSTGDEPMLINMKTGCPVIVHKDRAKSLKLIDSIFPNIKNPVIILDDGFQHRKVERDIDIVAINGGAKISERRFFPNNRSRGYSTCLRDDPAKLFAADIILSKHGSIEDISYYTDAPCFEFNYEFLSNPMQKICLVSAIADNSAFENMLIKKGFEIKNCHFFRDHHIFTKKEIDIINKSSVESGCERIITTSKDFVRLREYKFDIPLEAVDIETIVTPGFDELLLKLVRDIC